ncbi:hypothetical protein KY362_07655 [Candidatus Woesearchaeota archaeon]|nr:hypothetical protein [Candidatus Woesearchaeota archaeon]
MAAELLMNESVAEGAGAALNATVNETVTEVVLPGPLQYIGDVLWPRVTGLLGAPFEQPDMIWTLAPMIIALVLMQIYFGRNKEEALGWNTAFGNAIALTFISISLLRTLYIESGLTSISAFIGGIDVSNLRVFIIAVLFLYGIFLATISFFHWIPDRLAFFIMNGISINVTAYVVIVLVNVGNIPLDRHTALAGFVIFVLVSVVAVIVRSIIPASDNARRNKLMRAKRLEEAKRNYYLRQAQTAGSDHKKQRMRSIASEVEENIKKYEDAIKKI